MKSMHIQSRLLFSTCILLAVCSTSASVVVYPDYDERIRTDDLYEVSVTQNGRKKSLKVWDRTEQVQLLWRTHGGDCHRRWCEFAFDGGPVRVDVRVREDVDSYMVFPSRLRLKHTFKDGVISVTLDKPVNFGIRINDADRTILSVFADPPESDPPKKGAPGVMYVEGWVDAPDKTGRIETGPDIKEVYIAPGSVLNSRLTVRGAGTRVRGRGLMLDPFSDIFRWNQADGRRSDGKDHFFIIAAPQVRVEDIKLLDARTFNFVCWDGVGERLKNVRVLSTMMCSDGITFINPDNCGVDGAWIYNGDNALVYFQENDAEPPKRPVYFRDVVIGTSCAALFPETDMPGPAVFKDIDVFRADDGIVNNFWNAKKRDARVDLRIHGLSAVDCLHTAWVFQGRNMGRLPKRVDFVNCAFPRPTGEDNYWSIGKKGPLVKCENEPHNPYQEPKFLYTDNYNVSFKNLWLDGKPVDQAEDGLLIGCASNHVTFSGSEPLEYPVVPDRRVVNWRCPDDRRRRFPKPPAGANLAAEVWKGQSVFQGVHSWMSQVHCERETDGAIVYVLEGNAIHANVTDGVLASGNGQYRMSFWARAKAKDGCKCMLAHVQLVSNETGFGKDFELASDWKRHDVDVVTTFDPVKTKFVSYCLTIKEGAARVEFKDVSLVRK